ncbi:M14 family metallopeptidase [Amycolatopsis palatopharyngis]|uniref:M14 family metallopeptidase n=1 Tax=Amycolatopsis palatopharyngis TaxID=187982 RepID=UPI000E22462D|nr:M14 family metallopeptidase [Amycolatopsis palatopharyngis]
MRRRYVVVLLAAALVGGSATTASAAPAPAAGDLRAYDAELAPGEVRDLRSEGIDVLDVPGGGVELILTDRERERLRSAGIKLRPKDQAARTRSAVETAADGVYRPYSGPGGIEEEIRRTVAENPHLAKLVPIGETRQGKEILAVKLTLDARSVPDGSRPASLYSSTQHAREWITVETNRRLLHHMIDNYGTDREITRLLNRNEYWFVLVANPDGYDHTFTEGNRLWRKNLRDNDGDGKITVNDGVDLNRNFDYTWGYDNEGSSPNPTSQVYRGPAPGSEPETQALDGLFRRVDFSFLVNYHSAAQLLLYGVGWQVNTDSPDDLIAATLAGTDANPGVAGFDPDVSAELYTTNGETTNHAQARYGIISFTPEQTTCQAASRSDPNDEWRAEDCQSGFNFPDDEELIQEEFERNLPFALDIARSTADPANPESHLGNTAPEIVAKPIATSFGETQTVSAIAKRRPGPVLVRYRINDGRQRTTFAREWDGGERYGDGFDVHYAQVRADIPGAGPGDRVEVVFQSHGTRTEPFTYTVEQAATKPVLVIANEDYEGFDPEVPNPTPPASGPRHLDAYTTALEANDISYDVWDMTQRGAPDPLGVLAHYEAVVWYTGDNVVTQRQPAAAHIVTKVQQDTTLAVRDFLNEGGKLLHTGEYAGYFGPNGSLYFDNPEEPCAPESSSFRLCLYSNDFYQYYLGGFSRSPVDAPDEVTGTGPPLSGNLPIAGGDGADNQERPGEFRVTSDVLPEADFPQFGSSEAARYVPTGPEPEQPLNGAWYAGALHTDQSYQRLTRTVDLSSVGTASLGLNLSYDLESDYDFAMVEARIVGTDQWTTLADAEGRATSAVPAQCEQGFLLRLHPWLERYLTIKGDSCLPSGTSGSWNGFTGSSGWGPATFDLSGYAGHEVEIAVSYVTDPASGEVGVFLDDTSVTVDGQVVEESGFEDGLGPWTIAPPPEGSADTGAAWQRSQSLVQPRAAAVTTEDTVYLGFGLEAIATAEQRANVLGDSLRYLLEPAT